MMWLESKKKRIKEVTGGEKLLARRIKENKHIPIIRLDNNVIFIFFIIGKLMNKKGKQIKQAE